MKAVVLDTPVLVWLLDGNPRLGPVSRLLIEAAARGPGTVFSAIGGREIVILVDKGRLELDRDVLDWLRAAK